MLEIREFASGSRPVIAALAAIAWLASASPAPAAPGEYLPVGDAIESELRMLDILGPAVPGRRFRMPHTGTRPLQVSELDSLPAPDDASDFARRISLVRIGRVLAREVGADALAGIPGQSPRLIQRRYPEELTAEASVGAEGGGGFSHSQPLYASGSGVHVRLGLALDHWLAHADLVAGYQDSARSFADPIFLDTDITTFTSEIYLGYTGSGGRWNVQVGRSRWHWGPGEEASLLLSKTAPAITGLAFHVRLEPLRADLTALSATLRSSAGEQLAAHRIEWQPADGVRVGIAEAARYRASGWHPLYVVGLIPYQLVQRLQLQDEPGAIPALRNNVIVAADASWRVAPGTRIYGEYLLDDMHFIRLVTIPNKYAYQVGWEGVAPAFGARATWGIELTRVTRFVYTSSFGRDFSVQGQPLGFPFAPDARRLRVRVGWDPAAAWQLIAVGTETLRGENTLQEPFLPGTPTVDAARFEGVVTRTREIETGVRWWPAGGIDLEARAGYQWVEHAAHLPGVDTESPSARLALRLVR